jgi:prepilin-type N-terminal cleavage/methylation domain-containing protein
MTAHRARGFSLVEFIVAIVLLGILAVVVVSGVLSSRDRVENTRVEIALRSVELAEREYAATTGRFTADPELLEIGGGVTAVIGSSRDGREVSIAVDENGELWLAVNDDGNCVAWRVPDPMSATGASEVTVNENACDASSIANATGA